MSTAAPTPEYFDPLEPHIGFSGSDFDPPSTSAGASPTIRAAGQALAEGQEQTSLGVLESMVVQVVKDLTGVDLTDLFETVGGLIDSGIATVTRIVDDIVGIFNGLVVTPINNLVQGVKDWWAGLWAPGKGGALEQTKNEAITARAEAEAAAQKSAANEAENIRNSDAIAAANLELGTKAAISDIPTDVPMHFTLNPIEDPVFPRADLEPIPIGVTGSTEIGSGDSGHYHNLIPTEARIVWAQPVYTMALRRIDIAYINATRNRIYNTVGFHISEQSVASPATFRVAVFKMGVDSAGFLNGTISFVWASPAGGEQGKFGLKAQDIVVNIPAANQITAKAGDCYAVLMLQTGSGTVRNLVGKRTADGAAASGVHPSRLGMSYNGPGGAGVSDFPASLTAAQLDNASTWVPFAFMGQTRGLQKIPLVDLFDRANASHPGTNWAVYGVGIDIANGIAQCKRINHGNLTAQRDDLSRGVYVLQTSTDSQYVAGKITAFDRSQAELQDNPRAQLALRSNADMTRAVTVGIRFGLIEIRAYSFVSPGGLTQNSTTYAWSAGDWVELHVTISSIPGPTLGKSVYTAHVNGAPILEWTDMSSESDSGAGFRRQGFEVGSTHRGAVFGYYSIPSVGFNEWKAGDL
ncbi:hypothetical protein G8767_31655 [Rhodococcus sp. IC4_135]|uniref:DUF7257 domain-containing protein n=1 Tax=Rhodococcus sp. IC4_135 TaxID=2715537 RepID=UPI001420A910|nr:hypothetical protein [Rhodococcus sp. IC4_135]